MRQYVDCSSHNGYPDLKAYWNAGHRELMVKATEGMGYVNPDMQRIAREWHALGGRVGYYHWLHGAVSARAQFNWFWLHVVEVFQPGDWLMTDFEETADGLSDGQWLLVLREFNSYAAQKAELHVYTGNWYLADKPQCRTYLKSQLVVMSDYSHDPPLNPYGLNYVAHQRTDRATVAGFAGPVDYNIWLVEPTTGEDVALATDDIEKIAIRVGQYLQGTQDRVKADDPIIRDIQARLTALQAQVAKLVPAGTVTPVDARAFVDELGRRLITPK